MRGQTSWQKKAAEESSQHQVSQTRKQTHELQTTGQIRLAERLTTQTPSNNCHTVNKH